MNPQEKEVHRRGLYYVIPSAIMDSDTLEPMAKLLYALLSGLADSEGKCFPSDKYLSERMKCSLRQAKELVNQLEKNNLIERVTNPCSHNPFKKVRTITVFTTFKKSLRRARTCTIDGYQEPSPCESAQLCPLEAHTRALIESEAIIESEEKLSRPKSISPLATPSAPPVAAAAPTTQMISSQEKKKEKETSSEASRIAQKLLDKILAVHPKFKRPKLFKWALEVDQMHRIDGRSFEDIESIIDYAFDRDAFWVKTLQSPQKLREHFDKIWIKANPPSNEGTNFQNNAALARELKAFLDAEDPQKSKNLLIQKDCVVRRYPHETLSFKLPAQTFEDAIQTMFKVKKN